MSAAPPPSAAATPPAMASARVLVVDDDEPNRDILSRRLIRRGYSVLSVADGYAALDAVKAEDFDVVLLDVMMPGLSGLDVLTTLRKTHTAAELPVIMATANNASEDVVTALNLGANDYVTKPLDFAVVLARVQTQVALRQSLSRALRLEQQLRQHNADLEMANARLENANREMRRAAERVSQELRLATRVQASFLPKPIAAGSGVTIAWAYEPCLELAGDALNVFRLDAEHIGLYVLDVSGHGVASALTAVAAARVLAPAHDPDSILVKADADYVIRPVAPATVAGELSRRFAWNPETSQFITVFYGLLHVPTRRLKYASAGHPGAVLVAPGEPAVVLPGAGLPIGVDIDAAYDEYEAFLPPGGRLYLYSDGVTEAMGDEDDLFGTDRLRATLAEAREVSLVDSIQSVRQALDAWRKGRAQNDDVTLLALECGDAPPPTQPPAS